MLPRSYRMLRKIFSLTFIFLFSANATFAQRAANSPYTFAGFIEPDFPFINTTLNAGTLGPAYPDRNLAVRCLLLQLGNDAYACFDTDLLRLAAAWTGEAISLLSMPQVSYHEAGNKQNGIPEILGNPVAATGIYPGWQGEQVSFEDPRLEGPNPAEMGRGPIDAALGRWHGVSVYGNHAVLRYRVQDAEVREMITRLGDTDHTGIARIFEIQPHRNPLSVVLGEFLEIGRHEAAGNRLLIYNRENTVLTAMSADEGYPLTLREGRYVVLQIPPADAPHTVRVVMWKGPAREAATFEKLLQASTPALPDVSHGGPGRWGEPAITAGRLGQPQGAFAVDALTLPLPNRWRRNVRVSGLDFFSDGRAAVSTFEGDVWLVSGIDENLQRLSWQRYASGLSEPMSLSIVDDQVYTFGRDGIVRSVDLNGDGEADFYENFSNLPVQTGESREYPLSMHAHPDGGFLLSIGGALNNGPKTNPAIMTGFRAGGPHSGTVLYVSADGRHVKRFAMGLREPYAGVHPTEGWVTVSDQQGNFVPSTPIYFVQEGDYFGVPATAHVPIPPEITPPLTWIPHQVDRSATEQVWITSDNMGPLNGALVHLSYGKPGIYHVYYDDTWQGGIAEIPLNFEDPLMKGKVNPGDGLLYLSGFQVWDSDARSISGLSRVRYTGGTMPIPDAFEAGRRGVIMHFDQRLDAKTASNPANYALEKWNYQRTDAYGSGHFNMSGEPGHDVVPVNSAFVSDDGQAVFLRIAGMGKVMQMSLNYRISSETGDSLHHALYFTINNLRDLDLPAAGFSTVPDLPEVAVEETATAVANAADMQEAEVSAEKGQQIYQQMGCIACHSSDGTTEGRSGPTFKGLFGSRRTFNDGTSVIADETYIEESILDPAARVVAGKEVEMPSYAGVLTRSDINSIIMYLKSISP